MISLSKPLHLLRHPNTLKERLLVNASWLLSSNLLVAGITAVKALLLARFLGAAVYGELSILIATVALLNQFVDFRSIEAILKYVNLFVAQQQLDKATAVLKTALLVDTAASLLAYLLLFLAAPYAASLVHADPALLRLYGLTILSTIPSGSAKGLQAVRRRHDWVAWQESAVSLSQFLGILFLLLRGHGLSELVWLLVATELGKGILSGWLIHKSAVLLNLPPWHQAPLTLLRPERQELTQLLLSTNLVGLLKGVQRNIDTLLVSYWLGAAATGNYRLARNIANMLNVPTAPLYQVAYTEFAKLWHRQRLQRLYRFTRKIVMVSLLVAVAGITAVWLILPLLLTPLVGSSYSDAIPILQLLIIGAAIAIVTQYGHALLIVMQKSSETAKAYSFGVLAQIILLITLIPTLGTVGAAIAYLLFAAVHGLSLGIAVWPQLQTEAPSNFFRSTNYLGIKTLFKRLGG